MIEHRSSMKLVTLVALATVSCLLPTSAGGVPVTSLLPVLGWEDDVDLVAAPDREFLVLCEENPGGTEARVRILNLAPATGQVLGIALTVSVPGFENGVDPIVLPELEAGIGRPVLIPVESENGGSAGLLIMLLAANGTRLQDDIFIATGPLGFRPDTDGAWTHYLFPAVAFFPLESEDRSIRGVLAIDVDPRPAVGAGEFGGCTLLASAPLAACSGAILVDWLPGLADAVDPVAYEVPDCCARLALPVISRAGTDADLLLIDFDPNLEPPLFEMVHSVREINADGARPTDSPGFERDVDPKLFYAECGFGPASVLLPVEGPDAADLYLLDLDGNALWTLSHDGGLPATGILGYESGVDLLPICDPGAGAPRVAVPLENAAGSDADLWLVDLADGHVIARAEDPLLNPGLTIAGYEIGVDPVLWTDTDLVIPVEGPATGPGLIVLGPDGLLLDDAYGGVILGFRRSVDLIVDRATDPPVLYVPVAKDDGSDANVLIGPNPPQLGGVTLETANAGEEVTDFEWDVDIGLVDKLAPGGAYLYLPEQDPVTGEARLRVEVVPTRAAVAVATRSARGITPSLYFLRGDALGQIETEITDLLGLATGLDMADGRGTTSQDWQPDRAAMAGQDADSDPTLAWLQEPTSGVEDRFDPASVHLAYRTPMVPPAPIRFALPAPGPVKIEIVDLSGRQVRLLLEGDRGTGEREIVWNGLDEEHRRVRSGVYFLRIRSGAATSTAKLVVLR